MKKIILILAMIFPAFAYGKGLKPTVPAGKQMVPVEGKPYFMEGKMVVPFGEEVEAVYPIIWGVKVDFQLEAADISRYVEGCEEACFINLAQVRSEATKNGRLHTELQAVKNANLREVDAQIYRDTLRFINGVPGEDRKAALLYAARESWNWDDPVAQENIPVYAYTVQELDGYADAAAMEVFGLSSLEKGQIRDDKIIDNCQMGSGLSQSVLPSFG